MIGETQDETREVFIARAAETGSEIVFADQNFSCLLEEPDNLTGERKYIIADIDRR